jgi:hypothetical protein
MLSKLTALQRLQLLQVQLRSAAHAAALLDMLPQLQQLQLVGVEEVTVGNDARDWGSLPLHSFPPPQVVTNRQLQHFRLAWLRLMNGPLISDRAFWKQLFASQGLLPYLQDSHKSYPAAGDSVAASLP